MSTLRQDAQPLLADLERRRDEVERHLRNHDCPSGRQALADLQREEEELYRAIAEDEAKEAAG